MDLSKMQLLFKQEKYVQVTQAIMMIMVGYSFYLMSTGVANGLSGMVNGLNETVNQTPKAFYDIANAKFTIKREIYSGKTWILKPCTQPAGYCWVEIK